MQAQFGLRGDVCSNESVAGSIARPVISAALVSAAFVITVAFVITSEARDLFSLHYGTEFQLLLFRGPFLCLPQVILRPNYSSS